MEEREMERLKKQRENDEKIDDEEIERKGKALSRTERPYQWAMYDNWECLKQYYKGKWEEVLSPLTTNDDTVLHVVAFAGRSDVLEFLISLVTTATNDNPRNLRNALVLENSHGSTILHEVAASGNLKAAMLLVSHDDHNRRELIARRDADQDNEYEPDVDASSTRIVEIKNKLGETPFYRAASYGHTKLFDYFNIQDVNIERHLTRCVDRMSVLHIAVINQHFDTALWLLKKYPFLAKTKEDDGFTSLQLLAKMPSAFQVYNRESLWKMLIHKCLSEDDSVDAAAPNQNGDIESRWIPQLPTACLSKKLTRWPRVFSILKQIKKEKTLSELTQLLVEKDYSWVESKKPKKDKTISLVSSQKDIAAICGDGRETKKSTIYNYTPLLIATSTGILPLVKRIYEVHPQAIEAHEIGSQQNILHMSIKHRQLQIFRLVKRSRAITWRLTSRIDSDGNTILHRAADMTYYSPDTQSVSGPALQLQEELRWMVRAGKITPPHYIMHRNNKGVTAEELFNIEHEKLLHSAQTWIKDTAQSCSTVAALVATVVFAAAYTAPGGYNSGGVPVLQHSPLFTTFIITGVVSLISSLSSLVTFLSILTSPFEYKNFHHSLPLRLHLGFAFLFFSLVTAMLAFTATVVLLIHLNEKLTWSLLCCCVSSCVCIWYAASFVCGIFSCFDIYI
nr:protein ACCELERATED CELL DEATH 6-like [Malus domestica]